MVEKATLPEGRKYFYQLSGSDGTILGTDVNMSARATLSFHSETIQFDTGRLDM